MSVAMSSAICASIIAASVICVPGTIISPGRGSRDNLVRILWHILLLS